MNDLEYLNQISANVKAPAKTGFFDKKMKIIFGVLGGVILIFIIALVATSGSSKTEATAASELTRLYTRSDELSKTIKTYNNYVRSSSLRSYSAQLTTALTEITTNTNIYLVQNLGIEQKSIVATDEDAQSISKLNASLNNARLNGLLDRVYASELYYQINYLLIIEDSAYKKTTDNVIRAFLDSSRNSLNLLKESFYNLL